MDIQIDPISEVKKSLRLSSYAKEFTKKMTRKRPGEFRTACFIHNGDNPNSLSINDNLGTFHCFACGDSGDIFDMWMRMNGKTRDDFRESLEYFAGIAGVALPKNDRVISKGRLYEVQEVVARECMDFLLYSRDEDARIARDYLLKERGMTKSMIKRWRLGFMPEGDYATEFLNEITTDTWGLQESGLLYGKGRKAKTPFRGRIMFPIIDVEQRVVGFAGRVVPDIECYNEKSKYINSPETSVYHKSQVLYGEHLMGERPRRATKPDMDTVVTIEGQLDAIAVNELLEEGSVALAACGTAISVGHLPQLRRAKRIVELFDGDEAGFKAAIRTFWMLNHLPDTQISATLLSEGSDPWDMFQQSPDELIQAVDDSLPYMYAVITSKWHLVGESKMEMTDWIREQYSSLTSLRLQDQMITHASKTMGMSKSALRGELSLPTMINEYRRRDDDGGADDEALANENRKLVSLQTSSMASMLLSLPYDEMTGILSVLEPWNSRVESALSNWTTIINPDDMDVYKRLIFGVDAHVNRSIEAEVAAMQPRDDAEPQNVRTILRGMIQQMMTGINGIISQGYDLGVLSEHVVTLRNILVKELHCQVPAQPYILSFLLDCAMDIERVSEKAERDAYAAS